MKNSRGAISFFGSAALIVVLSAANGASAQERSFFGDQAGDQAVTAPPPVEGFRCIGPISRVTDTATEALRTTTAVFGTNPGGGEGGQFDKTPVLTTSVSLAQGACLDAHLSAIIGNGQTYNRSRLALFQVSLTRLAPAPLPPRHMVGHYETPYGIRSPAVALEAERDVDMLSANFFQRVGTGPHEVPPGNYRVEVFWAGAPPGALAPAGVIGAAFVLKLYHR